MQCTKLLISWMHGGLLWLNKEYPIHVVDLQRLTGLSVVGVTISTAFQTISNTRKTGNDNYYNKYNTQRGGKDVLIEPINTPNVKFGCYIIVEKLMRHFSRNECTMDTISVAENCVQGAQLNWCSFLLQELFEACKDVYKGATHFIYGYIVVTLAMWKWCPLEGQ